jgi:hypothetical protein
MIGKLLKLIQKSDTLKPADLKICRSYLFEDELFCYLGRDMNDNYVLASPEILEIAHKEKLEPKTDVSKYYHFLTEYEISNKTIRRIK